MDRRSLLKGVAGAVGATVGAFALRSGVDARGSVREDVPGQLVGAMTAVPFAGSTGFIGGHWAAESLPPVTIADAGGMSITYHADSTATLECLWRIVNDPSYVNYDRYGSDAESLARAGKMSVFPEYDARHPIERWSRGHFYTYHVLGVWVNPDDYQYADASIANQELTARALYVAHLARLQAETQSRITAPLLKPNYILGEIRPITEAPAFLSEPL